MSALHVASFHIAKMPAVTLINAIPPFVTQEEYSSLSASTPSSFSNLPAILKHKEENVSVDLQPPVQGFSDEDSASGTLYVLTRYSLFGLCGFQDAHYSLTCSILAFTSSTGRSFQVEYPSITLHAISRSGPRPSIYCQLDESEDPEAVISDGAEKPEEVPTSTVNGGTDGEGQDENDDEANEGEFSEMRELNIVPASAESRTSCSDPPSMPV